jgi:hypothetical protein
MILPLITPEEHHASAISSYLARSVAITQLALAASTLLLSGTLPLSALSSIDSDVATAYASPITLVTTLFHFTAAFQCYGAYTESGQTAFALGLVGSGFCAALGTWCLLFGGAPGRKSKRTGKDKRTSGWPFGDKKGRREVLKDGGDGIELKQM